MTESPQETVPPGTVVDGRYQVLSVLGRGAMGTVYRVEHLGIGREMALKVLHSEMGESPSLRQRFSREARSTAKLEHPGIVQVTDFGRTTTGSPYMVMELIRGRSLSDLSEREVPFDRAIAIMQRVLRALEHAHSRKIVHRDLKPDNIMLVEREEEADEVKVLDFGLAMLLQPQGSPRITHAGAVFGTPRYMSPEQASGEAVDHRADVYSVAVMIVEVLTGAALFDGTTAAEVLAKQVTRAPVFELPAADGWDVVKLRLVLEKQLRKHPKDRYPDARSFRKAITGCRLDEIPEAELSMTEIDAVRKAGGRRWLMPLALAAGLLTLGVLWKQQPDLTPARNALAAGKLEEAAEYALKLVEAHPKRGPVHLLRGHVEFARSDVKDALASYSRALELEPSLVADPIFDRNVRTLVIHEDPALAPVVQYIRKHPTPAAASLLGHIATEAQRWRIRRAAYEALEATGTFGALDPVEYLTSQLSHNSTKVCGIRKWYVTRLVELGDRRAAPTLEREQRQRRCARKLIKEALAKWSESP